MRLSNGLPLNAKDVCTCPRYGRAPSLLTELGEKYCDVCPSLRRNKSHAVVVEISNARLRKRDAIFFAIPLDPKTDPMIPADVLRGSRLGKVCAHPDKSKRKVSGYAPCHLRAEPRSLCAAGGAIELAAGWRNDLGFSTSFPVIVSKPVTAKQILVVAIFAVVNQRIV